MVHEKGKVVVLIVIIVGVGVEEGKKVQVKGNAIAIKIPEDEYQAGLQRCKTHLHGRLIFSKGDTPLKFLDLKTKLSSLWSMVGKWSMVSLGKGFYDFAFSSVEDMRHVCSIGSWNLKPGFLKLFLWTPDFIPSVQKLSHTQCWVRIHNLPQEYWSPKIIFSIAGGVGTPISLDDATQSRSFGHFAKVMVEINLKDKLPEQILVEREGFAFFVSLEYGNLPDYCQGCHAIGHLLSNCRKNMKHDMADKARNATKKTFKGEKHTKVDEVNDLIINLEIDKRDETMLRNMERLAPSSPVQGDEAIDHEDSDNVIVQDTEDFDEVAANDLKLVGKLWANDEISEAEEEFTTVVSKSQKRKLKKKGQAEKVYHTRRGGYLNTSK
ncbi:PREDICTED: uncharacterized protein LOC109359778 [Lupinus angustifolius]|uniref:uncharacterized protein LOC109359778 n=1 Tax=Lupinus angustifolius TaxID=3871 RepID=UPI00092FAEB5|nr:PREDICTED: uncharacterized protein LOC109359778 [Lupinus angustifolius]